MTADQSNKSRTIFVSYAREDRPQAELLISALTSQGFQVLWDGLIKGGSRFASSIEEMLLKAEQVVVIWSAHSISSNWVRDEAENGRDRGSLIPVTFDGTPPPIGFRQIHSINMAGWRGNARAEAFLEVVNALDRDTSGYASQRESKIGGLLRWWRPALVAAMGIAIIGVASAYVANQPANSEAKGNRQITATIPAELGASVTHFGPPPTWDVRGCLDKISIRLARDGFLFTRDYDRRYIHVKTDLITGYIYCVPDQSAWNAVKNPNGLYSPITAIVSFALVDKENPSVARKEEWGRMLHSVEGIIIAEGG